MNVPEFKKSFDFDQKAGRGNDQVFQSKFHAPLDDAKRHGICAGLAVRWVDRRMTWPNETPQQRRDGLYSDPGLVWRDRSQRSKGGTWSMYSRILERHSIAPTGEAGWSVNVGKSGVKAAAQEIARKVSGKHKYYLWIFENESTGIGHMVASYASGGKLGLNRHLYFFDANMGEYSVGISDAGKFVQGLINAYRNENFPIRAIHCLPVRRGAGQLWGKLGESASQMLGADMPGHNDWASPMGNVADKMWKLNEAL